MTTTNKTANNLTIFDDVPTACVVTLYQDTPLDVPVDLAGSAHIFSDSTRHEITYTTSTLSTGTGFIDRTDTMYLTDATLYEEYLMEFAKRLMQYIKAFITNETTGGNFFKGKTLSDNCKNSLKELFNLDRVELLNQTHTEGFFKFRTLESADSQFESTAFDATGFNEQTAGFKADAKVYTKKNGTDYGGPFFGLAPLRAFSGASIQQVARNLFDQDRDPASGVPKASYYGIVKDKNTVDLDIILKVVYEPPDALFFLTSSNTYTVTGNNVDLFFKQDDDSQISLQVLKFSDANSAIAANTYSANISSSELVSSDFSVYGTVKSASATTATTSATATARFTFTTNSASTAVDSVKNRWLRINAPQRSKYFTYPFTLKPSP